MDYKEMFGAMLVFTPILMFLSYLAGTAHDYPKKSLKLYGFRLRKSLKRACTAHVIRMTGPMSLVDQVECDICKLERAKK